MRTLIQLVSKFIKATYREAVNDETVGYYEFTTDGAIKFLNDYRQHCIDQQRSGHAEGYNIPIVLGPSVSNAGQRGAALIAGEAPKGWTFEKWVEAGNEAMPPAWVTPPNSDDAPIRKAIREADVALSKPSGAVMYVPSVSAVPPVDAKPIAFRSISANDDGSFALELSMTGIPVVFDIDVESAQVIAAFVNNNSLPCDCEGLIIGRSSTGLPDLYAHATSCPKHHLNAGPK